MDAVNRKLRVFLCHASEDKEMADILYRQLEAFHFDPWIDNKKLLPGWDWETMIEKELHTTDAIIVCLSNVSTIKSGYVQREIKIALKQADYYLEDECFLIPVKLNECEVPYKLQTFQYIELFDPKGFDSLMTALNARAEKLGLTKAGYTGYADIDTEITVRMINNSSTDEAAYILKELCKKIKAGMLPLEILLRFNNHPYFLIRKIAIEEIIKNGGEKTLEFLSAFKTVSYHVSQSLIREYIAGKIQEQSLKHGDMPIVIDLLEHMSGASRVSDISRRKDLKLLQKVRSYKASR